MLHTIGCSSYAGIVLGIHASAGFSEDPAIPFRGSLGDARGHGKSFTADTLEGLAQGSFYIRELDLVVEAPNGAIASFCTFRIDPVSRATELEPIGTHPDYRRRGLGKALIFEGMRLLKKYDPLNLYIDGAADNPGANHLYESTGFEKKGTYYFWSKVV
jgi:ribosomal protein S18 acetylase RimI-like enzyme